MTAIQVLAMVKYETEIAATNRNRVDDDSMKQYYRGQIAAYEHVRQVVLED